MPRTTPAQFAQLFNWLGGGLVHMEIYPLIAGCTCYTEIMIVNEEIVFCSGDVILIVWPTPT